MEKVKYGTKEYREAYNNKRIATYDRDSDTYNASIPLEEVKVTPRNNLDLGQVVRNGTSPIGKAIGTAVVEGASFHPVLGLARAATDMKFATSDGERTLIGLSAYPIPILRNLTKARKIMYPVVKTVSKTEPGVTRIALSNIKKELGHIDLSDSFHKTRGRSTVYPEYIKVNEEGKGLSKALYAGIKEMKKPIMSGEVLLQPEKTTSVYKYFNGPELRPLIREEGYNYPRKMMTSPKNKNLYEDTINRYSESTAKYTDNLTELRKLLTRKGGR